MSFQFLNAGRSGDIQEVTVIDTFIDPVSKIRVSNPSNLIDTDFEYGLQPTKWETVELINNTPAFFSRGGDTTIPDITGITTNAGTREITVTTAFPHNLDVGIPIRVAGTKSVTADGSYIINATPTPTTFTYLSRANQAETISIFDLYTSIISGEFFQGSQISISDAEGMVTDGDGPISTITVKTETKHGFGPATPFYFLNLNSTISQEFESNNNASVSFDPTNSATAQEFDGSNTLLQTPIDLSNSATSTISESPITSTSPQDATISVATPNEDWSSLRFGDPLYYSVSAGSGYFQQNPRGVVFIKSVEDVNAENQTATFQVSEIPDGDTISIVSNMTGFFQIADEARTFAGNNLSEQEAIESAIQIDDQIFFDGGNRGFEGDPEEPLGNVATVVGYTGTTMTVFTAEGELDYYDGAMLIYSTNGDVANGLQNNTTYFVVNFEEGASAGLYAMSIAELPQGSPINISGGSGSQTFSKIGVSVDKNIFHVRDSNFENGDMLEYTPPASGEIDTSSNKRFFFVDTVFDEHNYRLVDDIFVPLVASGGNLIEEVIDGDRLYRVHIFNSVGSGTFSVSSLGTEQSVEYLVVAGGGAGATTSSNGSGGGGGAGGLLTNLNGDPLSVQIDNYPVLVGAGGGRGPNNDRGLPGENSSFAGLTAIGGSGGGGRNNRNSVNGGSSGGAGKRGNSTGTSGLATAGQGNRGTSTTATGTNVGGGGGGAGQEGLTNGRGGDGIPLTIRGTSIFYAGGGGGGRRGSIGNAVGGQGGGGNAADNANAQNGTNGLGGGGGGTHRRSGTRVGGNGGSGVVIIRYPITPSLLNSNFLIASGGQRSIIEDDGIKYSLHVFNSNSTFTVDSLGQDTNISPRGQVEYLIVAGGGSGGTVTSNGSSGGGGAGGLLTGELELESTGPYSISVGNGGGRGPNNDRGLPGENSSFAGLTAIGGSGGGGRSVRDSLQGGSSGGAGKSGNSAGTSGQAIAGQGNRGTSTTATGTNVGGGGGGAGQDGLTNGNGGNGVAVSITGSSVFYAGGGGGGNRSGSRPGGQGGGGLSRNQGVGDPGVNGLGGGGGGTHRRSGTRVGGNGGSGVVIIRYPIGTV